MDPESFYYRFHKIPPLVPILSQIRTRLRFDSKCHNFTVHAIDSTAGTWLLVWCWCITNCVNTECTEFGGSHSIMQRDNVGGTVTRLLAGW